MTPISPVTTNPTFCAALYNTSAETVAAFGKSAKNLTASAGEMLGKVWASVSTFFASVGATLGQWLNTAKEGLLAAKDQIVALPKETKVVAGIALVATAAISWAVCSLYNKAPAAAAPAAAVAVAAAPVVAAPVVAAPVVAAPVVAAPVVAAPVVAAPVVAAPVVAAPVV